MTVETSRVRSMELTSWDLGGRSPVRPLARHYYPSMHAIIFVVDSNDRNYIEYAKEELQRLLQSEPLLEGKPLLVLANKQDLPNAMNVNQVQDKLQLMSIRNRRWGIFGCCATDKADTGIMDGIAWLEEALLHPKAASPSNSPAAEEPIAKALPISSQSPSAIEKKLLLTQNSDDLAKVAATKELVSAEKSIPGEIDTQLRNDLNLIALSV